MSIFLNFSGFSSETKFLYFALKETLKNIFYGAALINFIVYISNRDRCRTMINILGDAYGCGIVQHLSRADLAAASAIQDEVFEMSPPNANTGDDKPRLTRSLSYNEADQRREKRTMSYC